MTISVALSGLCKGLFDKGDPPARPYEKRDGEKKGQTHKLPQFSMAGRRTPAPSIWETAPGYPGDAYDLPVIGIIFSVATPSGKIP